MLFVELEDPCMKLKFVVILLKVSAFDSGLNDAVQLANQ